MYKLVQDEINALLEFIIVIYGDLRRQNGYRPFARAEFDIMGSDFVLEFGAGRKLFGKGWTVDIYGVGRGRGADGVDCPKFDGYVKGDYEAFVKDFILFKMVTP